MSEVSRPMTDRVLETAGGALNQGLFWRSNLASALRRRDYKGTFFGIALLSLVLFAYVWQHMLVVKLAYDVQALRAQKQSLTNQYYYLKYRMYDVDSLPKVESIARNQLGMVTPSTSQVVILSDDGVSDSPWLSWWTRAMDKGGKP
jgi:cell division protein FtsL